MVICQTCQSDDFFTDSQGFLSCNVCGTELHDYIQESRDHEDLGGGIHDSQGGFRRYLLSGVGKGGRLKGQRTQESSRGQDPLESSNHEVLFEAHQYCFRYMGQHCFEIIKNEYDNHFILHGYFFDKLKVLWFEYLSIFQRLNASDEIVSILWPSRRILLSLLYLLNRELRITLVQPHTLIRWCLQGVLPYLSLWEILPSNIRLKLGEKKKLLFMHERGSTSIDSTKAMIYYSTLLFETIYPHRIFPPLNAPDLARQLILQLQLPFQQIWSNYCQLVNIMKLSNKSFVGFSSHDELFIENVMAAVIIACKLVEDWSSSWCYRLCDPENRPLPANIDDIDHIPRKYLCNVLKRMEQSLPDYLSVGHAAKEYQYNDAIKEVLRDIDISSMESVSSEEVRHNPVVASHEGLYVDPSLKSASESTYLRRLRGEVRKGIPDDRKRFVAYARYPPGGLFHASYNLLLERCASLLFSSPTILHTVIEKFEIQILNIAQGEEDVSKGLEIRRLPLHLSKLKEKDTATSRNKDMNESRYDHDKVLSSIMKEDNQRGVIKINPFVHELYSSSTQSDTIHIHEEGSMEEEESGQGGEDQQDIRRKAFSSSSDEDEHEVIITRKRPKPSQDETTSLIDTDDNSKLIY